MKKHGFLLLIVIVSLISCQKNLQVRLPVGTSKDFKRTLTLTQIKEWYAKDSASNVKTQGANSAFDIHRLTINWNKASEMTNAVGNWWVIALPGQPTFQDAKQGYRKLAFYRDSTAVIKTRILEVIPDAAYLHQKKVARTSTFTGHVFFYDQQYRLLGGRIFHEGKEVGAIKPGGESSNPRVNSIKSSSPPKAASVVETCDWNDAYYVDAEGIVNIYTYQVCNVVNDDLLKRSDDANDNGGDGALGDGGGGGGDESSAPEIANLPQEAHDAIDPKAFMKCFSNLPDAGAKETVTVYVSEPWPGMPFNLGPNSVGHTTISLTKSSHGQTITQTIGFYPAEHKLAVTGSPSKMVDNGDMGFDVSITYNVQPFEFNAIINYLSNPASTYTLYDFNCTQFVYNACKAGKITLPDPTGNVGLFQTAMIPGALAASIRNAAPVSNANVDGGRVPESHGSCQ